MKLDRAELGRPKAPIRIVHIGLGAFHRVHQAWYTAQADTRNEWGIAAFTGRTSVAADKLTSQDCLYTVITRAADGDTTSIISSISEAYDGNNNAQFSNSIAQSEVAIVTLTITEAGYTADENSAISKLVRALENRRIQNGNPIAIVPCDNIAGNGKLVRGLIDQIASAYSAESQAWFTSSISVVSTSVDRITPATTQEDIDLLLNRYGYIDASPVVTEPFASWVLEGEFPLGRPEWELAGAKFVDDISVYESRKLWFLNGAHSLLAYAGLAHGYSTVAEAISDPEILSLVDKFWAEAEEASTETGVELNEYKIALLERFRNPRIAHRLDQIAIDGGIKLRQRVAPIVAIRSKAGRTSSGAASLIAYWIAFVTRTSDLKDSLHLEITAALEGSHPTSSLLSVINPDLAKNQEFTSLVQEYLVTLSTAMKG
jgi:fructuronate reductase